VPKTRSGQTAARESRLNVRIKPAQKAVIAQAARLRHTSITDFVVEHAFQAASQLIAEETQLVMSPGQYRQFCRALDSPPAKNLKAMQKLLSEPSVLDG
jgi:uncharacterized protein (DUF1778 family)